MFEMNHETMETDRTILLVANFVQDLIECLCILYSDLVALSILEFVRWYSISNSKVFKERMQRRKGLEVISHCQYIVLSCIVVSSFNLKHMLLTWILHPVFVATISRFVELVLSLYISKRFRAEHYIQQIVCLLFIWFSSLAYLLDWNVVYLEFPFPNIVGFIVGSIVGHLVNFIIATT